MTKLESPIQSPTKSTFLTNATSGSHKPIANNFINSQSLIDMNLNLLLKVADK